MTDLSTNEDFRSWTGRKTASLARDLLDCGHPNAGEVYFHGWCDRLTCSKMCAEAEHDCSAFAGAKSSTEEVPGPVEAVGHTWTVNPGTPGVPRANVCRNCGSWLSLSAPLCPPCEGLPPCPARRSSEATGQRVGCLLPAGHRHDHEDVTGSQWVGDESQVEALRSTVRGRLEPDGPIHPGPGQFTPLAAMRPPWVALPRGDGYMTFWPESAPSVADQSAPVAPPVDELVEPDAATCPLCGHATEPGAGPCDGCNEIARTYRGPWWSRLLPGRRTR